MSIYPSKHAVILIIIRTLQFFTQFLKCFLLLHLVHNQEPIHLVLHSFLVMPQLVQLHFCFLIPCLLILVIILYLVYRLLHYEHFVMHIFYVTF